MSAALGVGEYQLNSYLNEPLDMTVQLQDLGDLSREQILVELASQEQFDAAGVERSYFLNDLEFQVTLDGDTGQLRITSEQPVREPYLDFLVEFLWPTGRLMREYTVLLDPPSYADRGTPVTPARSEAPPRAAERPQPAPSRARTTPPPAAPQPSRSAQQSPDRERPPQPAAARPEPAPVAPTSSSTAASATPDTYRVRASDTLWRIADRTRPGTDVSVQQMMLAIQESNPDAFIDDNVNLVREGAVLRLPDGDQVRRLSNRDALARVATQNQEWQRLRQQRADTPEPAPVDATGRDTASAPRDGAGGDGRVTLVTPDSTDGVQDGDGTGSQGGGQANTAALQNELAIRDENLDSLRRENDELRSRIGDLDAQVSTSQRLLELRNEKIAALQEELRRLGEEQGADIDPRLLEQPATPMPVEPDGGIGDGAVGPNGETAGTDDPAAPANGGGEEAASGTDTNTDTDTDTDTNTGARPAVADQAGANRATPNQAGGADAASGEPNASDVTPAADRGADTGAGEQGGFLDSLIDTVMNNLLYIGVALLVLLLLLLLAVRRRRDGGDGGDDDRAPLSDDDDGGFDESPLMAERDEPEADRTAALQEDLDDDTMDPMERADVYVAYGQYPQAVDFLRHEINQAPERADLKIRLLELLREMNDDSGFKQQAAMFAGTSVAVDAAIKRLGGDPGEAFDGDDQAFAAIADDPEEDGEPEEELSLDDLELDLASDLSDSDESTLGGQSYGDPAYAARPADDDEDTLELEDFDFQLDDEPVRDPAVADRGPSLEEETLDLEDLDFSSTGGEAPATNVESESPYTAEAASVDGEDESFEFSLEDDQDLSFTEEELTALDGADGQARETVSDDDLGDLELDDLDVDLGEADRDETTLGGLTLDEDRPRTDVDELDLSLDDLNLSDDDAPEDRAGDTTLAFNEDDAPASDELEDLSLELDDAPAAPEPATPVPDDTVAGGPGEDDDMLGDDDDFDFLGETDENATKLDLARAYIDMGDAEGARDILNEVLSEGSEEQQGEARELLSRVS
ncbi:FimV/HubP family polar landmark protein [Alloalcanivorax marinus]|uniref:FimV/HubP family polar landmark protein n=1 Tax=Alloalcanivorax marinus TaxID=1177169 RepID=UPI0021CEFFD9|nr:FimV/HubP family polar landmark protein [Alloalcanivorax marinus]